MVVEYVIENQKRSTSQFLDLWFSDGWVSVLVETKQDFMKNLDETKEQLAAYVRYEREITGNKIIAILANTQNDQIMVWRGSLSDEDFLEDKYKR